MFSGRFGITVLVTFLAGNYLIVSTVCLWNVSFGAVACVTSFSIAGTCLLTMLTLSCRLYRLTGGGFVSLVPVVTAELVTLRKIQHVVNMAFFSMLLGGLFGTPIQRTTEETCRAYGSDRVCRCHDRCIALFAGVSSSMTLTW